MPYLHWAAPTPSSCPYMRPHNCPHNCPHARPRTPANVAWCVCTNVRTFSPQVRRRSGRRRLMPVPVGLLPIRPPGLPPPLRTRDPVPRCLGWLAAAALAYKGLARASNTSPSRVAWVGWLHTGCERACAPPSTLLRRLLRVVLPVKRDGSPDNPKVLATTLPACLAQRLTQAQLGLPGCTTGGTQR